MISLYNKDTGQRIGTITAAQRQNLIDILVEEHADDRDYYIDATTLDYMAEHGADPQLIAMIRAQLPRDPGDDPGVEVEWREE